MELRLFESTYVEEVEAKEDQEAMEVDRNAQPADVSKKRIEVLFTTSGPLSTQTSSRSSEHWKLKCTPPTSSSKTPRYGGNAMGVRNHDWIRWAMLGARGRNGTSRKLYDGAKGE